jgi:ubiquinone/menaquinone biosynthesis C-methylase UbiE
MSVDMGFLQANRRASRRFNQLFPARRDPMPLFAPLVRSLVRAGGSAIDIGGGRHPLFSPVEKVESQLTVTGVDLSEAELRAAPPGAYDRALVCDATSMCDVPSDSADAVYSRAVAEHVANPLAMFRETYRVLRPAGVSVHYVPNKWALFALLNAALPPRLSRRILYATRPGAEEWAGFRAYYRETTPRALERMFAGIGFREIHTHPYFHADYLDFFLPAHAMYVMWQNTARWLSLGNACESFAIVGRK